MPYIFRGALDVGATTITREMEIAAVHAIAELAQLEQSDIVARVTAIVMALYTVLFGVAALVHGPFDYEGWRAFVAQGWIRFASFLFVVALGYHAWIGMRDILMDYVKTTGVRLALHAVVAVLLAGYVGWAVQVLWRL